MGWCISDSESSEIIELFLSRVKARSPNTDVKVIMTDDGMIDTRNYGLLLNQYTVLFFSDNTGWSGSKAVYGDIKHLLCFWHVDR